MIMFNGKVARSVALGCALGAAFVVAKPAAAARNYYQGKTVTIVVPVSPGGGYDLWARLLAPYLRRYLGAAKVIVVNQPGAGGLIGTNYTYHSRPDGLTIGDTNAAGDVFAQMAHDSGVRFDVTRISWLGRPDTDPHVITVHGDGPYKTFDDLVKLKGTSIVVAALATGKGSSDYDAQVITYNAFDIPYHMVAAFKGSHAEKATFLSGEGTALSLSVSTILPLGDKARPVMLLTDQPFHKLPGLPTVVREARQHHLPSRTVKVLRIMGGVMLMGHAFMAPPGIPHHRLVVLRAAVARTFRNPAFLRKAQAAGLYAGYGSGATLAHVAQAAFRDQRELQPFLKAH